VGFFDRLLRRRPREERSEVRRISRDDALIAYIVREHAQGRPLEDVLDDPYLKNRTSEDQRARLLDAPEIIRAVGEHTAAVARSRVRGS
jgi:hypothetical protein